MLLVHTAIDRTRETSCPLSVSTFSNPPPPTHSTAVTSYTSDPGTFPLKGRVLPPEHTRICIDQNPLSIKWLVCNCYDHVRMRTRPWGVAVPYCYSIGCTRENLPAALYLYTSTVPCSRILSPRMALLSHQPRTLTLLNSSPLLLSRP